MRQIPLGKTSDVGHGDPHNQLTPVYPASPGKNLPPAGDVADAAPDAESKSNDRPKPDNDAANAAAPAAAATTVSTSTTGTASSGTASSQDAVSEPRIDAGVAAPNSCAIDACSSAYRSFRVSDCTYQPYSGPRKVCELNAGGLQNASAVTSAPPPSPRDVAPRNRAPSGASDLDAAARVVRQLPYPDDFEDPRGRRMIVIERPPARYEPRIIYEEW